VAAGQEVRRGGPRIAVPRREAHGEVVIELAQDVEFDVAGAGTRSR